MESVEKEAAIFVSWKLKGVSAEMLDRWFYNLEKGLHLWHPKDRKDFK